MILGELYIIATYFPTRFPAYVTLVLLAIAALIAYTLIAIFNISPVLPLKTDDDYPTHAAVARLI
jgi:Ni/Fe-hydrogenase subunit HybB-like protein